MNYRIKTCYGEFIVTPTYNTDVFTSAFAVYKTPLYEEEVFGDYVGEFFSKLDIVDNKKHFIEELEEWVKDEDLYNNEKEKCTKQREIIYALENLVHNRFSVKSLEKKLSEIFGGEEIHIEMGYIDVEDETAPDWNYMFTSEQDVIGGDFDIYVLMQRNKDDNGNTMYVTEVGYEFFNRYY